MKIYIVKKKTFVQRFNFLTTRFASSFHKTQKIKKFRFNFSSHRSWAYPKKIAINNPLYRKFSTDWILLFMYVDRSQKKGHNTNFETDLWKNQNKKKTYILQFYATFLILYYYALYDVPIHNQSNGSIASNWHTF